jgi:dihydroneopterin triphosphate aldolase (PTPS-III) / 6-pyruvoyltetrahydropterin synthase
MSDDDEITTSFEVRVAKDTFKFNAAHFVAFKGFRERLHGHNYTVAVRLLGSRKIGSDGYVIDFGDIKAVTKKVCKGLNEHFLCPMLSNVLDISIHREDEHETVKLVCEDGSVFVFPRQDCLLLPLVHATAEELAIYLWGQILQGLDPAFLTQRGIHTMEISVAEAVGQEALFRYKIPKDAKDARLLDIRDFIDSGAIVPTPCLPTPDSKKSACDGSCQASKAIFMAKLQQLADSINHGKLDLHSAATISAEDLEKLLK